MTFFGSDSKYPQGAVEVIMWKLAELGGGSIDRPDPNRWASLNIETKFMYRRCAEDVYRALIDSGYEVSRGS